MKLIYGENIKNQIRNFVCVDVLGFEPFFFLCCFVTFIYLFLFISRFRLFGAFPRLFWALGLYLFIYLFIFFKVVWGYFLLTWQLLTNGLKEHYL